MSKKISIPFLCLFMFMLSFGKTQALQRTEESAAKVVVSFKKIADYNLLKKYDAKVLKTFDSVNSALVSMPPSKLSSLRREFEVSAAAQDVALKTQETASPGAVSVNAQEAWSANFTGKDVKIAVIDSGISANHEDVHVSGGASFVDYTSSYDDDEGHGTHVAGIIAAKDNGIGVKGIAPDAKLYALKIADSKGFGTASAAVAAIDWSIKNRMDILNMSVTFSDPFPPLEQAVNLAYEKGLLIVCAVGNDGTANSLADNIGYPAKYPAVISVASVNNQNLHSAFSSTGSQVEVSAPGEEIFSTFLNNTYTFKSGTSMAAPYATGVLALLKEEHPSAGNQEIRSMLDKSAMDLGEKGKDSVYGYGLVQYKSLPDAPQKLTVSKLNDKLLISWNPSNDRRVKGYNIYVNGKKINASPLAASFAADSDFDPNQSYAVYATSVNAFDQESVPSILKYYPPASPPADVPNSFWASGSISWVVQNGWMSLSSNNSFSPNSELNRAEIADILSRTLKLGQNQAVQPVQNPFSDVKNDFWAFKAVSFVKQYNIMSGVSESEFDPYGVVSREQIAQILQNLLKLNTSDAPKKSPFADITPKNWSYASVLAMNQNGIIRGYSDHTFRPYQQITRAELATLLVNCFAAK